MAQPKFRQSDFRDLYSRWEDHPRYNSRTVVEDDPVEVIVQKLEMVLYTNQGDVIGDVEFGADLIYYLWQTELSNENLRQLIVEQIELYIPELVQIGYDF